MNWIFAASADVTGASTAAGAVPASLDQGSLVLAVDAALLFLLPGMPLVHVAAAGASSRTLTVSLLEDGRLHAVHRRGDARAQLVLDMSGLQDNSAIRLSLRWDGRSGRQSLSAEDLSTGAIRQVRGLGAVPLDRDEIVEMCLDPRRTFAHPGVLSVALGAGLMPLGLTGGLHGSTPIVTSRGQMAAADLREGDFVMDPSGRGAKVLAMTCDRSPALGPLRPVRLLAPYFGRRTDLIVDPRQKVVASGTDVEYLFEAETVLVEASALVDGRSALWAEDDLWAAWYCPVLARHGSFEADGCWLEGRFVGSLAGFPDILGQTTLAPLAARGLMPDHSERLHRVLTGWEAVALSDARRSRRAPVAA